MFFEKQTVQGKWVAVMNHIRTERGICLTDYRTRCVTAGEIHEFISCQPPVPGAAIDEVSYLGFAEIVVGGVLAVGDEVLLNDALSVRIQGFDYTHMPNHMNILVVAAQRVTGQEANLRIGQTFYVK